jgi:deazaflavin-dependent oxidoreductase (nitroreductase family)
MASQVAAEPTSLNRFMRRFNKRVTNPILMHLAGRANFYASVLHHVGRSSGRQYVTPVVSKAIPGGRFLMPLPYGADTDWCRNVLAAGGARLEIKGESVQVVNPRVSSLVEEVAKLSEETMQGWESWRKRDMPCLLIDRATVQQARIP